MKNIVLIGIMGCGKTTLAQMLSDKLNRPMVDIDQYIEEKYQMSISDMFAISEDYFRERETICSKEVAQKENMIISTGGGVIKNEENMRALKKNGLVFYIDRPIEDIITDVDTSKRPLLQEDAKRLYALHKERNALYTQYCDYHIINNKTLDEVLEDILACLS